MKAQVPLRGEKKSVAASTRSNDRLPASFAPKKARQLRAAYESGRLGKREYIERMYRQVYAPMFEVSDLIDGSIAKSVSISKAGVEMLTEDGIRLNCRIGDRRLVPFEILNFGDYEGELWRYVITKINSAKVVLDIGGNIGYFSLFFSKRMPDAVFHCFEPCRPTFEQLVENIRLNKAGRRIVPHNFGFSDKDGFFDLYYDPEACGSSSMKNLLMDGKTRLLTCKLTTIDNFVQDAGIGHVDFVKLDIEGSELLAIKGGLDTLKRDHPVVFCEMLRKWCAKFGYHPDDIIRTMSKIGYRCHALNNLGMRQIDKVTEDTVETNFLFCPMEKFL